MLKTRKELITLRQACMAAAKHETRKILVCAGTGCVAGGSLEIYDAMKARLEELGVPCEVSLDMHAERDTIGMKKSGCHGFCEMGPLVRIEPQGWLYTKVKVEDCEEIIETTLVGKKPFETPLSAAAGERHALPSVPRTHHQRQVYHITLQADCIAVFYKIFLTFCEMDEIISPAQGITRHQRLHLLGCLVLAVYDRGVALAPEAAARQVHLCTVYAVEHQLCHGIKMLRRDILASQSRPIQQDAQHAGHKGGVCALEIFADGKGTFVIHHHFAHLRLCNALQQIALLAPHRCRTPNRLHHRRVDLLQQRNQLMTDAIAAKVEIVVACILTMGDVVHLRIGFDLLAAHRQEGANELAPHGCHAAKPLAAAAADELQQHGLRLILCLMSSGDALRTEGGCRLLQKGVTAVACRFFDAETMLLGIGGHIAVSRDAGDLPLGAKLLHKAGIGFRFLPSEAVVIMRCRKEKILFLRKSL